MSKKANPTMIGLFVIGAVALAVVAVLIIAGGKDDRTTLPESRKLFQKAPEPKMLWVVEGAGHQDFHRYAPKQYERRVLAFLDRYIRSSPPPQSSSP